MVWLVPEHKLDPQQRDFTTRQPYRAKNIWIRGFPGSGKSVLLAYTLKQIRSSTHNASVAVVVFTRALVQMFTEAFAEMGIDAQVMTYYEFMKSSSYYDYVICDEVQDFVPSVLRAIKKRAKHVVAAGDENQSIYERPPKCHEDTVSPADIPDLLAAEDVRLGIIHRLSSSIINAIQCLMPGMNIFSGKRDMTKATTQIRIGTAREESEEVRYVMREAGKAANIGETAAVLLPKNKDILMFADYALTIEGKPVWDKKQNRFGKPDFTALNHHLSSAGIRLKYVGSGVGSFKTDGHQVFLMTYHNSKGLDFDNVFLPFMNNHMFITGDEARSKTVFMVAMTRSRNNLYITYSGKSHHYLDLFSSQCSAIDIHDALSFASAAKTGNSDNIFGI